MFDAVMHTKNVEGESKIKCLCFTKYFSIIHGRPEPDLGRSLYWSFCFVSVNYVGPTFLKITLQKSSIKDSIKAGGTEIYLRSVRTKEEGSTDVNQTILAYWCEC